MARKSRDEIILDIRSKYGSDISKLCTRLDETTSFYVHQWDQAVTEILSIGYTQEQTAQLIKEMGSHFMSPKMCVEVANQIWSNHRGIE